MHKLVIFFSGRTYNVLNGILRWHILQDSQRSRFEHYSETREQGINSRNDVSMYDRRRASVSGVKEVISFDCNEILLETTRGTLAFKGKDLHVKRLTLEKGEVDLEGEIDELKYSDSHSVKDAGSFLGKLFK